MTRALQKHEVAAAWMVEPFVTYAELTGAQPIADTDEGATQNIPIAGYMVTQSVRWSTERTVRLPGDRSQGGLRRGGPLETALSQRFGRDHRRLKATGRA